LVAGNVLGGYRSWMDTLFFEWMDALWAALSGLPALPTAAWVGLTLLSAVWLGERLQRAGGVAGRLGNAVGGGGRTVGYWLCGALFGVGLAWAQVWGGLNGGAASTATAAAAGGAALVPSTAATLHSLSWIFDLALGWVLVELGQRIDLRWLLRNRALAATAVLEYALTWGLAALVLHGVGMGWLVACVAATLAAHSSPVLLSTLLPQWRAEGQVTERSLHLGSINTVITAITLPVVLALAGAYAQGEAVVGVAGVLGSAPSPAATAATLPGGVLRSGLELAQPLWEVAGSLALGFGLGWLLSGGRTAKRSTPLDMHPGTLPAPLDLAERTPERAQWLSLLGAVCVAVGLAQWWGAPALVACLALGLSLRRRAAQALMGDMHSAGTGMGQLAQVLMFLVAGACLPWLQWAGLESVASTQEIVPAINVQVVVLALLLLVVRLFAKTLVCTLTARWAGLRWVQGLALGLTLQPLSMTGLVFWSMAATALTTLHPAPYMHLSHALLLMLCLSDLLAPWLMRGVLRRLREVTAQPAAPAVRPAHSALHTHSSLAPNRVDTAADAYPPIYPDGHVL
jgi:Kef-type K+ transport system membrane component KefB